MSTLDRRRSGVLLHLGSLPGAGTGGGGNGALGEPAHRFVDLLADAGFTVWQMLPVGPAGDDGSPYFSISAHAGNARLIDRTRAVTPEEAREDYETFVRDQRHWLPDDALFFALKAQFDALPWWEWPQPVRDREPRELQAARDRHREFIERFCFDQFLFQRQWQALKRHANDRGVRFFGDMPIYVAHDSAEVWTHREDFQLDAQGHATAVSGVPPDYFSADGQLWGNPLYDWQALHAAGFPSWIARVRTQLQRFDLLRIDHFRGLEAYWSVPAGAKTAREGHWRKAPGFELLKQIEVTLGRLPLIAEDLGMITPEVLELRDRFGLPGMCVLQFGFDGSPSNPHLPHNHPVNAVAYTGTHDNDTTLGWYKGLDNTARKTVDDYLCAAAAMPEALVRACLSSVARLAVLPLQDLLALDSQARMNTPGTTGGNWTWSFDWEQLTPDFTARWRRLNGLYGRTA